MGALTPAPVDDIFVGSDGDFWLEDEMFGIYFERDLISHNPGKTSLGVF